jgi:hypothetical protein
MVKHISAFGAMGNGVDDDTYAFKLSIERQGVALISREDTYKITESIDLQEQSIIGGGKLYMPATGKHGIVHKGGETVHDYSILGEHDTPFNEVFAVTSVDGAGGYMNIRTLEIDGFTNGLKIDQDISGAIDMLDVKGVKGNVSGTGYAALIAGKDIEIAKLYAKGDRASLNGRHGLYLSATAQNINVGFVSVQDFVWDGLTFYAYSHQDGVKNIRIKSVFSENCGGGLQEDGNEAAAVLVGSISVFGKVSNIDIYDYVVKGSHGTGVLLSAHGILEACDNINFWNGNIQDSQFLGILSKGAKNCNFYGGLVQDSSHFDRGAYSNIGVMSYWETGIPSDNINFYGMESKCSVDGLTRNAAQINQSTPIPTNTRFLNCDFGSENFARSPENI